MHGQVDAPDDQHAILALHLTGDLSRQFPVAGIDVARFQRTSEGPEHSTHGRRDDVVNRGSMGFGEHRRINLVMLRDGALFKLCTNCAYSRE